jgi:hypothetical protein
MVIQLITLTLFILFEQYISLPVKIIFVISTILTLINCGAIMEQKRWVFLIEYSRLLTMFLLPFYSLDHWQLKLLVVMLLLFPLLMWYRYIRVKYYRYVYRG